jgi:fructose-1,6-bisphosphatase/inositol monophosphatase family enzyme
MANDTIDYRSFLDRMSLAALQAGAVALQFRGKVGNIGKEVGHAYDELHRIAAAALSDVDLAAQEILLHALDAYYPFVRVEPEEDTPLVARFASNESAYTVVLDPIDGTLNYLTCEGQFAVALGLLCGDRFDAVVVYFPLLGELYRASRGDGVAVVTTANARERDPRHRVVFHGTSTPEVALRNLERAGYEPEYSRCSMVDSTVLATRLGRASVYDLRPSIRRCIGMLVSAESGGYLCDLSGRPYDCTRPDTLDSLVIAPDRETADGVRAAFAPRDE